MKLSVAFQATGSFENGVESQEYAAAYNTYRPRGNGNRPLCTFCGKIGHTVQKCFEVYGYPPGYTHRSSGGTSRAPYVLRVMSYSGPRSQARPFISNPQRTIANVVQEDALPYYPHQAVNPMNLDISKLTPNQVKTLIHQLS